VRFTALRAEAVGPTARDAAAAAAGSLAARPGVLDAIRASTGTDRTEGPREEAGGVRGEVGGAGRARGVSDVGNGRERVPNRHSFFPNMASLLRPSSMMRPLLRCVALTVSRPAGAGAPSVRAAAVGSAVRGHCDSDIKPDAKRFVRVFLLLSRRMRSLACGCRVGGRDNCRGSLTYGGAPARAMPGVGGAR
jgi:hypothetical protein